MPASGLVPTGSLRGSRFLWAALWPQGLPLLCLTTSLEGGGRSAPPSRDVVMRVVSSCVPLWPCGQAFWACALLGV